MQRAAFFTAAQVATEKGRARSIPPSLLMIKEVSTAINLPHLKKKMCCFLFSLSLFVTFYRQSAMKKKKRESTPSERNKHTHTQKKKKRAIQQARLHKSAQRHTIKQCQFQRPSKQKQKCFQNSLLIKKKRKANMRDVLHNSNNNKPQQRKTLRRKKKKAHV